MISIPIAVYNGLFEWQLDLFWKQHKKVYGNDAYKKTLAVIIERNKMVEKKNSDFNWNIDVPKKICLAHFDYVPESKKDFFMPLNIQVGLLQVIDMFDDEEVIELLDCDMFHIKPFNEEKINDDEFFVSTIYEEWHLKSLSSNKHIVEKYLVDGHGFYNGGFVPIIGKAKTFKKILNEWVDLHIKMVNDHLGAEFELTRWWCGMYSFQAACANNNIKMIDRDWVYIPPANNLTENHYICHYSCDKFFSKKKFPKTNPEYYPKNAYYDAVKDWFNTWKKPNKAFKLFL
jgi:hypothetical protein